MISAADPLWPQSRFSRPVGLTVTNQNLIREEIKGRFNLCSACYLLSPCLLF
jgi:hypothetical protein